MEKEENIINKQMDDDKAPAQATTPALKPEMSKGERVYNWVVYEGINYWVNLISSIAIADYLIHKGGRVKLDWAIGKAAKALEATGMPLKNAYKNSKTALETLSLMSGGWALLVPMKLMEDHKRWWVHNLNDWMGVDQTAPDGHKETPDEIYIEQEQPKQSWLTAFKRRIYATLAVVGTGQIIEHALANKKIMTPDQTFSINPYDVNSQKLTFEGHHMGGKEWAEKQIVGLVNKAATHLPGGEAFTNPGSWMQRWLGLAALDTGFTKITALVMRLTNGAQKAKAPHEIGDDAPPIPAEIGDELKPGDHRECVVLPAGKHVADILPKKDKSEGFADAIVRQAEAAGTLQMGA
ncbi:MAG: hypothetical protein SFX19_01115 [Alphaproteobacteria bacterium]|nr:hypothetical protein [Alphaproteobacteria bacterium]